MAFNPAGLGVDDVRIEGNDFEGPQQPGLCVMGSPTNVTQIGRVDVRNNRLEGRPRSPVYNPSGEPLVLDRLVFENNRP